MWKETSDGWSTTAILWTPPHCGHLLYSNRSVSISIWGCSIGSDSIHALSNFTRWPRIYHAMAHCVLSESKKRHFQLISNCFLNNRSLLNLLVFPHIFIISISFNLFSEFTLRSIMLKILDSCMYITTYNNSMEILMCVCMNV